MVHGRDGEWDIQRVENIRNGHIRSGMHGKLNRE